MGSKWDKKKKSVTILGSHKEGLTSADDLIITRNDRVIGWCHSASGTVLFDQEMIIGDK